MSKFYRGKASLFNPAKHKDGLYFATDINELYVAFNEDNYRIYGSKEIITGIALNGEGDKLVINYRDNVIPVVNPDTQEVTYTNQATINLVELMVKASEETAGLMSSEDKINLDALVEAYENNELGKVQGLVEGESILNLSDDGYLSATVNLKYDEENKEIKLIDKNGNTIGTAISAAPFIKDGMLENVEVITDETDNKKYIEFTWNITVETEVEGEKVETTKTDRIALEEIVVAYVAGNGIEIDANNNISVKAGAGIAVDANGVAVSLAEGTGYTGTIKDRNFLEFDNNNKLKMPGVTTDYTVLQEDILIAGLSSNLGSLKNGDTIAAGTSIFQILSDMLSKESYPAKNNGKVSEGVFKTTYGNPSFTLKKGNDNASGTIEVGTVLTASAVTGTAPSNTGTTSRTYSGFTNGYGEVTSTDAEGVETVSIVKNTNPPSVNKVAGDLVSGTSYKLTRSYSLFGQTAENSSTSESAYGDCSLDSIELTVAEGTNKVTCTMEGPVHKGTVAASPKYYVLSNKFNYKNESGYYVAAQSANNNLTATLVKGSTEKSVTGAYYYYIGYADAVPTTTDQIKALTTFKGWLSTSGNTIADGGTLPAGKTMCICVAPGYSLSGIMNGFDLESKDSFTTSTVSYSLPNDTTANYTIYSMKSEADWNYKTIKIVKA